MTRRILSEHSGKRSRLLLAAIDDESRRNRGKQEGEQQHDHGATARTMTQMAFGTEQDEVAHVAEDLSRRNK